MSKITRIGLDTANNIFHIVGINKDNKEVLKKKLNRNQMVKYFTTINPCTIALEACGGSPRSNVGRL